MIEKSDIKGLIVATSLYFLQGIPLGLYGCFFLVLKDDGVDYSSMGVLSFAIYPFSLKLFYASIVDAVWIPCIGQRKSWIIFAQAAIGIILVIISVIFDDLVIDRNILALTAMLFTVFIFLTLQDIAVDGWCLTLMSEKVIGAAATCQTGGQLLGSLSFNLYFSILKPYYDVEFSSYILGIGVLYMLTALIVLVAVRESNNPNLVSKFSNISTSYKNFYHILRLPAVQVWLVLCLTSKLGFAASTEVFTLRLRDNCVENQQISTISLIMKPINIFLTLAFVKYMIKQPINVLLIFLPIYIILSSSSTIVIKYAKEWVDRGVITYYLLIYEVFVRIASSGVYLSVQAFHFQIADPDAGGLYMTMLNSAFNFGGMWVETAALKAMGWMDSKQPKRPRNFCSQKSNDTFVGSSGDATSINVTGSNFTTLSGTSLNDTSSYDTVSDRPTDYWTDGWDSFYSLAMGSLILGLIWYVVAFKHIKRSGEREKDAWRILHNFYTVGDPTKGETETVQ